MSPWTNNGILGCGRFSVGWNLHASRSIKTVVIGIAWSFNADRVLVTIGPVTFVWLREPRTRRAHADQG